MSLRSANLLLGLLLALALPSAAPLRAQDWPTQRWPVANPDAVGIDVKPIAELDAEIGSGKYSYIDSLLVIRHGKIICERAYQHDYAQIFGEDAKKPGPLNLHHPSGAYDYFNPFWHPYYRHGELHTMQSVTKTVTSIIIGIAVGRKEFPDLDTPILRFFDEKQVANVDERKRKITIRHLLTMTAGIDWNEDLPYSDPNNTTAGLEGSYDWVKFVIDRPMAHDPGTTFQYTSGGAQLLSHIFYQATGKDIEEYAADFLFAPLNMEYYWKRSPSGLIDTEGGLYLKPHDLAKLGLLFLKNGVWNGSQIVPADWVKASVSPQTTVDQNTKYGYLWWLAPYDNDPSHLVWSANGFGGQRLLVIPERDLIIVFTGWNILDAPGLSSRAAIQRILPAIR